MKSATTLDRLSNLPQKHAVLSSQKRAEGILILGVYQYTNVLLYEQSD